MPGCAGHWVLLIATARTSICSDLQVTPVQASPDSFFDLFISAFIQVVHSCQITKSSARHWKKQKAKNKSHLLHRVYLDVNGTSFMLALHKAINTRLFIVDYRSVLRCARPAGCSSSVIHLTTLAACQGDLEKHLNLLYTTFVTADCLTRVSCVNLCFYCTQHYSIR